MTEVFAVVLILLVTALIALPLTRAAREEGASFEPAEDELWQREKAVAMLAISEADFDRATGKLTEDDYQVLRDDYEGRAIRAMDELEAIEPQASLESEQGWARFCGGCGRAFVQVDRFCAGCGHPRS